MAAKRGTMLTASKQASKQAKRNLPFFPVKSKTAYSHIFQRRIPPVFIRMECAFFLRCLAERRNFFQLFIYCSVNQTPIR